MKNNLDQLTDNLERLSGLVSTRTKCGFLFNPRALWVGAHYSPHNKRWCINLLPCVTLWIVMPLGNVLLRGKL